MPTKEQSRKWIERNVPTQTPDRKEVVESLTNYHDIVLHHETNEKIGEGFAEPMRHSVANEAEEVAGKPMVNRLKYLHRRQRQHTL